ncbi:MAG: hypothetical protein U0R71_17490 [Solirubrobacterales bacterium]
MRAATAIALALVALLLPPAAGRAALYWNQNYGGIARANQDGGLLDLGFVSQPRSQTLGVAADSGHLYWSSAWDDHYSISRSNLAGQQVEPDFIDLGNAYPPGDVAVGAGHIYWVVTGSPAGVGSIARANLDGSAVDLSFITAPERPAGVAVDAGHIYWTNYFPGLVGRANLDGTGVVPDLVSGDTGKLGLAVDGGHLYWANDGLDSIGRANLDGSGADETFVSGTIGPSDVAVDGGHVFWSTAPAAGYVGRAALDGTSVEPHFIAGVSASSIAADDATVSDRKVAADTLARPRQPQGRRILLRVSIATEEAVTATLTGTVAGRYALTKRSTKLPAGQRRMLTLRLASPSAQRAALAKLAEGPLRARLRVAISDAAGNRSIQRLAVDLPRSRSAGR